MRKSVKLNREWLPETKNDLIIKYLLFSLSPFLAAVYSIRRLNTKSSFLFLFLFGILFGASFSADIDLTQADSGWYREVFESYQYVNKIEYLIGLQSFLAGDTKDYFLQTVAFFISRFTNNYHYFFLTIAIVFSYFSLKSLRFLVREKEFNFSVTSTIFLYLFLKVSIIEINGVRYWTAYWIAIYCIFQIFVNRNKSYYLLALITPFFHGTYLIFIGMLALIEITKRFKRPWVVLFFISFFVSSFAFELLNGIQQYLPAGLARSVDSYVSEDELLRRENWSGYGWIPKYFSLLIKIYLNLLIVLLINNINVIKDDMRTKYLFSALIIWATVFNFFSVIPSLGIRNFQFLFPMLAYIWLIHYQKIKYRKIIYFVPVVFFWDIIFNSFNRFFQYIDFSFLYTSPLLIIYKYLM